MTQTFNPIINDYLKFWDTFVGDWFTHFINKCPLTTFENLTDPKKDPWLTTSPCGAFLTGGKLDPNELPEPYQGDPGSAKFVIVNLNPGASCGSQADSTARFESSKFLTNYHSPWSCGKQIDEFADSFNAVYSEFIDVWACLKAANRYSVCGGTWWQGTKGSQSKPGPLGGRMEWISRFAGYLSPKYPAYAGATPDDVFAMEACPFHSISWSDSIFVKKGAVIPSMVSYLRDKILVPAAAVSLHNGLKCVVCVGNIFNTIIPHCFPNCLKTVWDENNSPAGTSWPKNAKQQDVKRTYTKYEVVTHDLVEEGAAAIEFLVLTVDGSNKLPGMDFENIDKAIATLL